MVKRMAAIGAPVFKGLPKKRNVSRHWRLRFYQFLSNRRDKDRINGMICFLQVAIQLGTSPLPTGNHRFMQKSAVLSFPQLLAKNRHMYYPFGVYQIGDVSARSWAVIGTSSDI
jgi:hypothetical protein